MTRIVGWRRFIELRLEDDGGRPVAAFGLRPMAQTRARMAKHRLLARPRGDGLALYYQVNPAAVPPLLGAISARQRFSFALLLREPDFFRRHHPDFTAAGGAGLQLDNLDAAGAILPDGAVLSAGATVAAAEAVAIGRRAYAIDLDLTASSPASVEARDPVSAAVVASADIVAPPGAAAASVVLDLAAGDDVLFRLAEVPAGPLDRRAYADDAVAAAGAAGVIDLYWETAQSAVPDPAGVVYRAVFQRR